MRNIIFFAFLLVVTALTGQNNSYYYNGEKHSLKVIPHYLYITVSNKLDDFKSTLETEPVDIITSDELLKCIIIDTRNVSVYNRLWELCMADSRVETISPVYGDAEQNHLITCDSRVAVRLKDGTTKSELDKILDKFGCHIFSKRPRYIVQDSPRSDAAISDLNQDEDFVFAATESEYMTLDSKVKISPNPGNGPYWVQFSDGWETMEKLIIWNSVGSKMYELKVGDSQEYVLGINLHSGVYTMIVEGKGETVSKKIIVP